jgi:hypothetical protein
VAAAGRDAAEDRRGLARHHEPDEQRVLGKDQQPDDEVDGRPVQTQ